MITKLKFQVKNENFMLNFFRLSMFDAGKLGLYHCISICITFTYHCT